jgi:hypothetical protein
MLLFENLRVPASSLLAEEGGAEGSAIYIMDGLKAECLLTAGSGAAPKVC